MSNIDKYSKIKAESLREDFYFQSLLQEAYDKEELNDMEIERIQLQCIKLLADNTERFNKGESSSVRIETANAIMASSLFTIGIYLKSLPGLSSALDSIKNEPLSKLYMQGRRTIDTKLNVAKQLYQFVCKTKIQNPNFSYNDTIEKGIKTFFRQYNADFEAHEIPASIDYQLANPVTDLTGVEYIIQYLQNLYAENLFCSKFDYAFIHEVMSGYDKAYKDLLVNIFGQVLQNALGCALSGKDILSLDLTSGDVKKLGSILKGEIKESINILLQRQTEIVLKTLSITGASLKTYIYKSLPEIASRIYFAAGNETLQTIFVPRYSPIINQT